MRRIALTLSLLIAALPLLLSQGMQKSHKALTNSDVVAMVKNDLSETVIVAAIQNNETYFDVSANALIALKKAGVSKKIMETMIAVAGNKKNSGGGEAPDHAASMGANNAIFAAPQWHPIVAYMKGKTKVHLTLALEATQIVSTKAKPTSLAALARDATLDQALQVGTQVAQNALLKNGPVAGSLAVSSGATVIGDLFGRQRLQSQQQRKVTYVWALSGGSSPTLVAAINAAFDVTYTGLPGVNEEQFEPVIVKLALTPQANFRLVGATVGATNAGQDPEHDWPVYSAFVEDRAAANITKFAKGRVRISPAGALSAGQYAVALRPVDRGHKFCGEEVGKNQGEGLLFNYVWSFAVD